jgi:serine/threonine protein kinase
MFYELLTGERPFKGGAVTLMRKHVLEDPPALKPAILESVGPRFDPLIQKLMKKSAGDRVSSAAELLQALADLDEDPSLALAPAALSTASPTRASAAFAMTSPDGLLAEPSGMIVPKKNKPRYGLAFLVVVALGVGSLYWLGISPRRLWGDVIAGQAPTALPLPVSASLASASTSTSTSSTTEPVVDTASASAAAPSEMASSFPADSTGFNDLPMTDSDDPSPDDSATTAATAPHHSGPHVTQGRPATKPIHKTNKGTAAPRHGGLYVPPPSQWFKN